MKSKKKMKIQKMKTKKNKKNILKNKLKNTIKLEKMNFISIYMPKTYKKNWIKLKTLWI